MAVLYQVDVILQRPAFFKNLIFFWLDGLSVQISSST